ncbi:MAG: thioredoxin-dependent thiol peroxidase [Erysipelotrichaceae bacterium]
MNVNEKAFDFALPNKDGEMVSLHDFLGKKVVVYFYPKDNTPGCTEQACNYRDSQPEFNERDVVVIGISKDSQKMHTNFTSKFDLNFILLSDEDLVAIQAYDVWKEKKLYGKTYMGVERTTFLIDETGTIVARFEKVSPKSDPQTVLAAIDEMK